MGDLRVKHSQTHPSSTSSLCLDGVFLLPSLRWYSSATVLIQHMSYRCCLMCYLKYLYSQELRTNTTERLNLPPSRWMGSKCEISCFYSLSHCVALNVQCTSVHGGVCTSTCLWMFMNECLWRKFCCLAQITLANCSLSGDLSAHIIVSKGEAWESNILLLQILSLSLFNDHQECFESDWPVHMSLHASMRQQQHIENIFSYCCI